MDMNSPTSPSKVLVGAVIGLCIMVYAVLVFGVVGGLTCTVFAVYEGWTLVNRYENDTITETVQSFAAQTAMVPLIFGVAFSDLMHRGLINEWGAAVIAFLLGHFFMGKKLHNWRQGRK
jgi:ABC-type Na+ efflux pump permease subunit